MADDKVDISPYIIIVIIVVCLVLGFLVGGALGYSWCQDVQDTLLESSKKGQTTVKGGFSALMDMFGGGPSVAEKIEDMEHSLLA